MCKLTRKTLNGIWAALITPWNEKQELDELRYIREIDCYAGTGVHGLYTGGTTGEFYAQDDATFDRVAAITIEEGHRIGLPVQIGVTALSTRIVNRRIRLAHEYGADGVQVALPFWLEMKDDEVIRFFHEIYDSCDGTPVIFYQTGRAKRKLSAELIGRLADEIPGLIGLKETGSTPAQLAEILRATPDLSIFGGDNNLVEKMRVGARGSYSAVVGLNPRLMVSLYKAIIAGHSDDAERIQRDIRRMLEECLIPIAVEAGLEDSAIDRIQRAVGGGDVGLNCQSPYRQPSWQHVERLQQWCVANAPSLIASKFTVEAR